MAENVEFCFKQAVWSIVAVFCVSCTVEYQYNEILGTSEISLL